MNPLKSNLDPTDWAILHELQADARLSYAEIGRRVGLSSPAVQERLRKLEDLGIIRGYTAQIDHEALGLPIKATIRLSGSCRDNYTFREAVTRMPQVLLCHHVVGDDCFHLLVAVRSMKQLEDFIECLYEFGETSTTVILTSPVEHRIITADNFVVRSNRHDTR